MVLEIKQTETFRKRRTRLKDEQVRALIAFRLDRLAFGWTAGGKLESVNPSQLQRESAG